MVEKLNVGCGEDHREGWLNVDVDESVAPDTVVDIERTPWPWDRSSFSEVLIDNVLEHIRPGAREDVIEELHRVTEPGGTVVIRTPVPEVGCGWDLTHYTPPGWRWPLHPRWEHMWQIENVSGTRVGPGRALPEPLARLLTRFWIARCVDEVSVRLTPVKGIEREGIAGWP